MRIALGVGLALIFLIIGGPPAGAEQYEYKEYKVKKGDTLWRITMKELKDPFQWPMVWKENQRLNNPDKIYPGQVIRIPVRVLRQEEGTITAASEKVIEQPEAAAGPQAPSPPPIAVETIPVENIPSPVAAPAPPLHPAIKKEAIQAASYISTALPYAGEITGSPDNRSVFGLFDEIYIKTAAPAKKSDKLFVVRKDAEVRHPETRQKMGFIINIIGTVEIKRLAENTEAVVTRSTDELLTGDVLDMYYEVEAPLVTELRMPDIRATVAASTRMKAMNSMTDIVFLDKGKADGLEIADVLMTLMPGSADRGNAVIQIINVRDNTSTALVLDSKASVGIGDKVTGMKITEK